MTISVIIPTLNEAARIAATIEHIRRHSDERVSEIIVVDGHSTDGTAELARAAGATVLQAPEKGRARQMNLGAAHSQGDVLYFVHADTLPPPSFVAEIAEALHNGWQMGTFRSHYDSPLALLRFNAFFTRSNRMFTQGGDRSFFVARDVFVALGAYRPEFVIMEEFDFFRRAQKAGYTLAALRGECLISARKFERNSWLRVQFANFLVFNLWNWGLAKPPALKRIYWGILRRWE
jgi:rSAM/selenodomain-associated transferase 2